MESTNLSLLIAGSNVFFHPPISFLGHMSLRSSGEAHSLSRLANSAEGGIPKLPEINFWQYQLAELREFLKMI